MFNKKDHTSNRTGSVLITYCDKAIIILLFVIIVAVTLFFDIRLHNAFDLSKVTILFVLIFTILTIWSIKTLIVCWWIPPEAELKPSPQNGLDKDPSIKGKSRQAKNVSRETTKSNSHDRQKSRLAGIFGYDHTLFQLAKPLNLPIIAVLSVSGLATIFSISPYLSLVGAYRRYDGFVSTFVYIILFYTIVRFIRRKRLDLLLTVIIITAGITGIYSIPQHFGLDVIETLFHVRWSFDSSPRVCSTFGNPVFFSAFLIMVIPLVLVKIFSNPYFRYQSYLYIAVLAILIVTLYYTKTRACFLGLIISNLFFFSLMWKKIFPSNKAKMIVTLTILIGISIFYNTGDPQSVIKRFIQDIRPAPLDSKPGETTNDQRGKQLTGQVLLDIESIGETKIQQDKNPSIQDIFLNPEFTKIEDPYDTDEEGGYGYTSQLEGSTFLRIFAYITGTKIIHDYPILGIGPDTLGTIFRKYVGTVYRKVDKQHRFPRSNWDRMHNIFLDIAVSRGLLGLGVYAWFMFAYTRMIWKGYGSATSPRDNILIIGLCSGCLGYFIQNQFSFGDIPIITLFWFLVGMSVIACAGSERSSTRSVRKPLNILHRQTDPPEYSRADGQIPTRWFNSLAFKRLIKTIIYGLIVCLMALFVTLSLSRYKADIYLNNGQRLFIKLYNSTPSVGSVPNSITKAIESFEMAIKHNPLEMAYSNVLNFYYLQMAVTGLSKDSGSIARYLPDFFSPEQSITWLTNAVNGAKKMQKLYPYDYVSAYTLGQVYHILDNMVNNKDMQLTLPDHSYWQEAVKYYKKAITLHFYKFEIRNKLAQLYVKKGYYQEAIQELKEIININPSDTVFRINLARILIKDSRYAEAQEVLLELTERMPNHKNLIIHRLFSYIYYKTEKWDEVLEQSKKIIKLDQENIKAHKYMIIASIMLKRYEVARKSCNRILELAGPADDQYKERAMETLEYLSKIQAAETITLSDEEEKRNSARLEND